RVVLIALAVHLPRIERPLRLDERERERAVGRLAERYRAIEARAPPGVAGAGARLLDLDPHRVLVAVDAHLKNALHVARALALAPQRAARAAVVPGFAGLDGA